MENLRVWWLTPGSWSLLWSFSYRSMVEDLVCDIQDLKNWANSDLPSLSRPWITMKVCTAWNLYWDSTHSRPQVELIYISHHWRCWRNGRFLVPLRKMSNYFCYALSLQESNRIKNQWLLLFIGLELLNYDFIVLEELKSIYMAFWVMKYFPLYNPFPHRCNDARLSLVYHYFNGSCSDELDSLVTLVHTVTGWTLPCLEYSQFILILIIFRQ